MRWRRRRCCGSPRRGRGGGASAVSDLAATVGKDGEPGLASRTRPLFRTGEGTRASFGTGSPIASVPTRSATALERRGRTVTYASVNGRLRDACLRQGIFYSLRETQTVIGLRQSTCDRVRPHAPPGYRPSAPATVPDPAVRRAMAAVLREPLHRLDPRCRSGHTCDGATVEIDIFRIAGARDRWPCEVIAPRGWPTA
jgi:hypothetical protein